MKERYREIPDEVAASLNNVPVFTTADLKEFFDKVDGKNLFALVDREGNPVKTVVF